MKYSLVAGLLALSSLSACVDLEELNVNPNNATQTTPGLLLTDIAYDAFSETSTTPAYASKMLVQTDGESDAQVYKWTRGGFDYYNNLRNVVKMMEVADAQQSDAYKAIALFFKAHYFYKLTLTFGDIPYSEALSAESQSLFMPKYDSQESVFEGVLNDLAEANRLLTNNNTVISGDIIYGGNVQKWRRLVNAYRLRVLITLSGKQTAGSVNVKSTFASIVANEPLFEGDADNGQVVFLDQQNNRYPHFNSSGFGSGMYMDSTYIQALKVRKDPRLFAIATMTPQAESAGLEVNDFSAYDGGDPAVAYNLVNDKAAAGQVSKPNQRYYKNATNEPMVLMGYPEQQLILAEAVVRGWIMGDEKNFYESAVRSSFRFFETYAKGYSAYMNAGAADAYLQNELVAYNVSLPVADRLKRIVMQKYLPSFLQGMWNPFFEHLRTGYPDFRRSGGTSIPYRWMYPQAEYNNNTDNVKSALQSQFDGSDKISDKTWWLK